MKILTTLFSLLMTFAFVDFADAQNYKSDNNLPNFGRVNSHLFRGAQPTENGVKELAGMGVKTIINLRGAGEKTRAEELWAQNNGIKFVNISLSNWREPKDGKMREIMNLLDNSPQNPVFIHCQRGADRTGMVIAFYRITRDGWTRKKAGAEAKDFGLGWWQLSMKDYLEDYCEDLHKGKVRSI